MIYLFIMRRLITRDCRVACKKRKEDGFNDVEDREQQRLHAARILHAMILAAS